MNDPTPCPHCRGQRVWRYQGRWGRQAQCKPCHNRRRWPHSRSCADWLAAILPPVEPPRTERERYYHKRAMAGLDLFAGSPYRLEDADHAQT